MFTCCIQFGILQPFFKYLIFFPLSHQNSWPYHSTVPRLVKIKTFNLDKNAHLSLQLRHNSLHFPQLFFLCQVFHLHQVFMQMTQQGLLLPQLLLYCRRTVWKFQRPPRTNWLQRRNVSDKINNAQEL